MPLAPPSPKAESFQEFPIRVPKLCIGDLDFSDLGEDEDEDMLNVEAVEAVKGGPTPTTPTACALWRPPASSTPTSPTHQRLTLATSASTSSCPTSSLST